MSTELKPCPFCGSKATISHNFNYEPDGVICLHCHAFVKWTNFEMGKKETFGEAQGRLLEKWNRRAEE